MHVFDSNAKKRTGMKPAQHEENMETSHRKALVQLGRHLFILADSISKLMVSYRM